MFDKIAGIPAHPLLVHAAVVFVPLLALGAVVYGAIPALRFRVRWPVALLAVAGAVSVVAAHKSGEAFESRLRESELGVYLRLHPVHTPRPRRYSPVAVIKGEAKSRCVHTELMDYA